ncbi:hypothetical protein FOZ63_012388, partial [Perkinsus olseni]
NPDDLGLVPRTPASINQPLRIPFKSSPYVGSQAAANSSTSPSKAGVKALATLCVERAYVLTVESFEPAMGEHFRSASQLPHNHAQVVSDVPSRLTSGTRAGRTSCSVDLWRCTPR